LTNIDNINALEDKLNGIVNDETLLKVKSMKLFSSLNSEKPTPIFLSLARTSNSSASLKSITEVNGIHINQDSERTDKIVEYYENMYRNTDLASEDYSNCIDRFLGPDVAGHPIVTNSKLTESERLSLDSPLTIAELDDSLDKCNVRSAPGIDGFSNAFIKASGSFFVYLYSITPYVVIIRADLLLTSNLRPLNLYRKKGINLT
jgi:hypothetical protein